jgi:hypothetical protein
MVRSSGIIGFFDLDGEITTADTKRFLRRVDSKGNAILAGDDLPRSFVLVSDKEEDKVIYTRLTTQSLTQRAKR